MTAEEILELPRVKMDCNFFSDLPFLIGKQRAKMLYFMRELTKEIGNQIVLAELYSYLKVTGEET